MTPSEELPHLRSLFRQSDAAGKLRLVRILRDRAIERLEPKVTAKLPRPLSDFEREAGGSSEWNLHDRDDASAFAVVCSLAHARGVTLSASEQSAAQLLGFCAEALESGAPTPQVMNSILDAVAGLDTDTAVLGQKFMSGRKPNTGGPIRNRIKTLLRKTPTLKNGELWTAVTAKPPRGWIVSYDGDALIGPTNDDGMKRERFNNVCGEERKKLSAATK